MLSLPQQGPSGRLNQYSTGRETSYRPNLSPPTHARQNCSRYARESRPGHGPFSHSRVGKAITRGRSKASSLLVQLQAQIAYGRNWHSRLRANCNTQSRDMAQKASNGSLILPGCIHYFQPSSPQQTNTVSCTEVGEMCVLLYGVSRQERL